MLLQKNLAEIFAELSKMKNIAFGQKNGCKWQNRILQFKDIQMAFFGNATLCLSKMQIRVEQKIPNLKEVANVR